MKAASTRPAGGTLGSAVLPEPRPDLVSFAPYRTQQMDAQVRLQANEWAEPNPAARYLDPDELEGLLLNRYPGAGTDLRTALAQGFGVAPEQIVLGNGSNEVLLYAFLLFGGAGRRTLLYQPTYSLHERLAVIAGSSVVSETVGLPYALTAERAVAAVERERPEVVVLCSPNNPTGTVVGEDVILAVARAAPRSLVLVDEAYADFAGVTVIPRIADHPNLAVVRTFSKARAAAGLRLGALVAHPQVAGMFRAVQLPYNVNAITQAVATKIVADDASLRRRVELCRVERERVQRALAGVEAVEAYPSAANFVLFRLRSGETADLHARLLEHGVLVRDLSSWPGCAGCLRVSIGTPPENDRFIAALGAVLAPAATVPVHRASGVLR
ncbi:MAG: histidinol-phosphate transaminase [Candidatus Limnocylindria bacterium]